MDALKVGQMAPEFCLPDIHGGETCLADLKGSYAVVYFYPRDGTPGCTKQAKDFSAAMPEFERLGVKVVGINPDSLESHRKFIEKNELTVPLLSDTELVALKGFGVWDRKTIAGKMFNGVVRSTFILDPEGRIVHVWPKVKVLGHIDDVLHVLKGFVHS